MNQPIFVHGTFLIPLLLGLVFAFSNGFRDSSTIVATVVSTRTLSPTLAFLLCAIFEFCGALFLGSAVASTIGVKVLGKATLASQHDFICVAMASLSAAIIWGFVSWWRAWPTSNSHAILGGLTGAGWAAWGIHEAPSKTMTLILVILMGGPLLGFLFSLIITCIVRWIGEWLTARVRGMVESLHVLACLSVSCVHGSNDGQLVLGVLLPVFGLMHIPSTNGSLRLMVAFAMAAGVLMGGRRILKKLGLQFYRIRDPQGMSAELTSAGTIFACGLAGFPASSTQVVAGAIMGAGAAKNFRSVRWAFAGEMVLSWLITFPSVAVTSAIFYSIFNRIIA